MKGVGYWLAGAATVMIFSGCQKPVSRSQLEEQEGKSPETAGKSSNPFSAEDNRVQAPRPKNERVPAAADAPAVTLSRKETVGTRSKAVGTFFVSLQIGEHYFNDVRIQKIDDSGVQFRLKNGLATFPWSDVPKMYRKEWGYDSDSEVTMLSDAKGNQVRLEKSSGMLEKDRIEALKTQVEIIDTRIGRFETVLEEAQGFHRRLTDAFQGIDPLEAKKRAEFLYARIRESRDCSSCAPPTQTSGSVSSPEAVRDRVLQALARRVTHFENEIEIDQNRREQLMAAING